MNNKELLIKIEDEYYNKLINITNVRDFNKEIGNKELKKVHNNKSSFKIMLGYLINQTINKKINNSSYITFGMHFTFNYLLNFLKMTPFDLNSLAEHKYINGIIDGDRLPYYFNYDDPNINRIDSDVLFSLNDMMLNIDFKYYCDNKDEVLNIIKGFADVYNIVTESYSYINNEFILVPKGYKVDKPEKYTREYALNHKKDGEIYFRIYPYKFKYSFLHLLKNKFGNLNLLDCLTHYKYSYKYDHISEGMLYPATRERLKGEEHTLKSLFNECLIDYELRDCQQFNSRKIVPSKYFIFLDDIYHKFIDMNYSPIKSFEKCEAIRDYSWSSKEEDEIFELKELYNKVGDIKFEDIINKLKYRYYDDVAVEFYYLVQITLYKYKYREEYEKLHDEHTNTYSKCLQIIEA